MKRPSDLQVMYQQGMFFGTCCAVGLAVIAWITLRLCEPTSPLQEDRSFTECPESLPADTFFGAQIRKVRTTTVYTRVERTVRASLELYGYGRNIRIIPEAVVQDSAADAPHTINEVHPQPVLHDEVVGDLSSGAGTEDTWRETGLDFGPVGGFDYFGNNTSPPIQDRPVTILRHDEPEYPFIARESGREGVIIAIVYVNANGLADTFPDALSSRTARVYRDRVRRPGGDRYIDYAIVENEPDWFFADSFRKVFPKWEFLPKLEGGKAVGTLLTIRYTFCLGTANCMKHQVLQ